MLSGGSQEEGPATTAPTDWDVLKDGYIMKSGSSMLDWEEEGEGERDSSSLEDS